MLFVDSSRAGPMSGEEMGRLRELSKSNWNLSQEILELVAQPAARSTIWKVSFPGSSVGLSLFQAALDGLRMSFSSSYYLYVLGG